MFTDFYNGMMNSLIRPTHPQSLMNVTLPPSHIGYDTKSKSFQWSLYWPREGKGHVSNKIVFQIWTSWYCGKGDVPFLARKEKF